MSAFAPSSQTFHRITSLAGVQAILWVLYPILLHSDICQLPRGPTAYRELSSGDSERDERAIAYSPGILG